MVRKIAQMEECFTPNIFKANFLNEMKSRGKCEMEFHPDAEFVKKFGLPKDRYSFQTHKQLDEFMYNLMLKCPTFNLDYENERTLLKSFDRAFWLRHFKKPDLEQFRPGFVDTKTNVSCIVIVFQLTTSFLVEKTFIHRCPFEDPRETGTMAVK